MVVEWPIVERVLQRIELEIAELRDLCNPQNQGQGDSGTRNQDSGRSEDRESGSIERESQTEETPVNVDGTPDKRFKENRPGPTGQGQVKDPEHDLRLKENRPQSAEERQREELMSKK